jgi:class 3 adenylate cyclase/tetratricopeptide (TPR) repeat protein
MVTCRQCGQENPAGFRLCGMCGASLTAAAPAREERKVVTVLFADLVGFTSRAERMDPEDVRALLAPYWQHLRAELERFGGTVEKFIGDAVVALFGAPVAHEDDPERAVRAALAIRDWVLEQEAELQVRIAVNTGEALVALGARPEAGEGMASGDVVNTAARLQAAAPVNGVLAGETTYRATQHAIEYREQEPVEAKGKAEPVRVWEAVQPRARLGMALMQAPRTPLVGRGGELRLLHEALTRMRQERSPQLVTLVGVPGIGKSRLVYELMQIIQASGELTYWRQGRSLPYGEGVTFWALAEMVKAQAGILETDSPADAQAKLSQAVSILLADDPQAQWVESHLRPLVGLTTESTLAGDRRGESFAAWRRFFEAMAEQRPLVLVFEDLHWADDDLLDFVDHLVEWAGDVPLLVVATARPELLDGRPGWGGGKRNAVTISLSPLDDEDTAHLIADLLERPVLPVETQSALLAHAGGNPLYAEQFARMLSERGSGEELPLPESVQGIIAARLDLLAAAEKLLLHDAAVIGRVFWTGALVALDGHERWRIDELLHALERKDFVQSSRRSSVSDEREYAFRHVLVRDVAYSQIPRAARADKHQRAAVWIESLGRPEDHAEMLAHHYVAALELARAAGGDSASLAEPAQRSLREAGDRASALNAFSAAARFYERALELGSDEPADPDLLLRFAEAAHFAADERRIGLLERARERLVDAKQEERAAEADALLAEAWWQSGQTDRCHERLQQARKLVETRPPSRAKVRVLAYVGRYLSLAAQTEDALRVNREVLALAETLGLEEMRLHALAYIGFARVDQGDLGGIADIERVLELGLAAGSPETPRFYGNLGAICEQIGYQERALELNREAINVAERFGNVNVHRHLRGWQPTVLFGVGRWDEALDYADTFIAECEAGSPHYLEQRARFARAQILLARDDAGGALRDVDAGLERSRAVKDPQVLGPGLATGARLLFELERRRQARTLLDEMLDNCGTGALAVAYAFPLTWIVEAVGAGKRLRQFFERGTDGMPWVEAGRAVLAGDPALAADVLEAAGCLSDAAFGRLRAAEMLAAEGRRAEADEQLRPALAFYRTVGATRYLREGETLLAASA